MLDFDSFEVLTFDCYGTLIDWETGILDALKPSFHRAGMQLDGEAVLEAYGALEAEMEAGEFRPYKEILKAVLERLCEGFGFRAQADEMEAFSQSVKEWPAFADSPRALSTLKSKYKLAILSNIDRDLFEHSALKLGVEFDYVFTAEDIGSYKPSTKNFEYAMKSLPFAPDKILHVAQSLYHDIGPAGCLGLKTVWINRRQGRAGAGATPPSDSVPDAEYEDLDSFSADACAQMKRTSISTGNKALDDFYNVPVNKLFSYKLVSRSSEETVLSMEAREEFLQEEGLVQGGILSAIADTAAVYTFYPDLAPGQTMTSIEFKVNFLRPAAPGRGPLTARAKVVQRGKKVGICDVEVLQSEAVVLKGLFTYMFYEREGGGSG